MSKDIDSLCFLGKKVIPVKRKILIVMLFCLTLAGHAQLSITQTAIPGKIVEITLKNTTNNDILIFNVYDFIDCLNFEMLDENDRVIIDYYPAAFGSERVFVLKPGEERKIRCSIQRMTEKHNLIKKVRIKHYLNYFVEIGRAHV